MPRQYISKVQVPTGGIYYIKDDEARAQIAQIGNFSRYLGVATDMPTNTSVTVKYIGDTGEETITYTTTSEEPYKLSSGDVVTVSNTTTEPYGEKEYIFNGTGWAELNTVQGLLKAFAYVSQGAATFTPSVTKTGTVTVSSTTLASTAIPATFSTTKVTGATAIKTVNAITTRSDIVTGVDYSKATGATATGTTLSKTTDTIYGASSALKVMTGADSLDKKNISVVSSITAPTASFFNNASVAGEILTFAYSNAVISVTPTNASVLSSTTGITAGTSSTLISKTFVTNVTVSAEPTITITNTKTAADLTATTVVSSITTSTMYGKVSAYAGGDHTHGVSDTIAVSGNSQTITVEPKSN